MKACEWPPRFPSYVGCYQRDSFVSHPIQNTDMCCVTGKQKAGGRTADRALRGHQSDTDLADQFADSIRKSDYKLLGMQCLQILPLAHGHTQSSIRLTCTHLPLHGWISVHVPNGSKSKVLQMGSEHAQKAGQSTLDWEKLHKLEHSVTL